MKSSTNRRKSYAFKSPPILLAVLALITAGLLCLIIITALALFADIRPPLYFVLATMGLLAAVIGLRLKLAKWWGPILVLLPSALGLSLTASLYFSIPAWVYLACFFTLLIVYWNVAGERVPLYLTNARTWAALEALTSDNAKSFIDLGCGLGGVVIYLARHHSNMTFTGIESAPVPYLIAKMRVRLLGLKNVDIRFSDFWTADLAGYDTVYAFLSPEPMDRLFQKVSSEMRPGSLFISNSFAVKNQQADEIITVEDRRNTQLHVWRR